MKRTFVMIDIFEITIEHWCTETAGELDSEGFDRVRDVEDRRSWPSGIRQARATLHPLGA